MLSTSSSFHWQEQEESKTLWQGGKAPHWNIFKVKIAKKVCLFFAVVTFSSLPLL